MELTIKKPAVIEPSHMPRTKRATKRPAKFLQAACAQSATAHIEMLKLDVGKMVMYRQHGIDIMIMHTSSICRREIAGDRDSGETRKPDSSSRRLFQAFKATP